MFIFRIVQYKKYTIKIVNKIVKVIGSTKFKPGLDVV